MFTLSTRVSSSLDIRRLSHDLDDFILHDGAGISIYRSILKLKPVSCR